MKIFAVQRLFPGELVDRSKINSQLRAGAPTTQCGVDGPKLWNHGLLTTLVVGCGIVYNYGRLLPRIFLWALCIAPVAYPQNIGLAVNGACVAGSCAPQPLQIGSTVTMPVATTLTLASGDIYSFTGTITTGNPNAGGLSLLDSIQVIYLGNGGKSSQGGKITMDLYAAYQTAMASGDFEAVTYGSFSPSVGVGGLAQLCVASSCGSAASSQGSFYLAVPFSKSSAAGEFLWDITLSVSFAAGLPVGSYVFFSFPSPPPPFIRQTRGAIGAGAFGGFSSIAPGSWIEVYGADLAIGTRSWGAIDFNGTNAPTSLGGTSVTIGGQAAFIEYVSPTQVNAQVPSGVSLGFQDLVVNTASGSSTAYKVNVTATQPGLLAPASFLINGTQYVLAVSAQDAYYILPPGSLAGASSNRAKPGDTIILYGSGFGPVTPNIPAGQVAGQANSLAGNLNISFGGAAAIVVYAGLSPGSVGLYQFNVVVPNIPANDRTPVTFSLAGTPSTQTLYLAVGN